MRKAVVPESVIMEITGHSTREMFDRYNTIDEEDTRNAINQLSRMFDEKFREKKLSKMKVVSSLLRTDATTFFKTRFFMRQVPQDKV